MVSDAVCSKERKKGWRSRDRRVVRRTRTPHDPLPPPFSTHTQETNIGGTHRIKTEAGFLKLTQSPSTPCSATIRLTTCVCNVQAKVSELAGGTPACDRKRGEEGRLPQYFKHPPSAA